MGGVDVARNGTVLDGSGDRRRTTLPSLMARHGVARRLDLRSAAVDGAGRHGPALLFVASAALTVLGLLLHLENRSVAGTERFFDPVMPAAALAFPATGAFVAARRPGHPLGWLFGAGALLGVAFFAEQYAVSALQVRPQELPGGAWMAWVGGWAWVPGYLLLWTLLPLLFPDGHAPSSRWRPMVWLVGALIAVTTVLSALGTDNVNTPTQSTAVGLEGAHRQAEALYAVGILVLAPLCWTALLMRGRRSTSEQRSVLRWPTLSLGLTIVVPVSASVFSVLAGASPPLGIYQLAAVATVLGVPVATVVAVVGNRLVGIETRLDTVANRLLVNGGLVASGAVGFVMVISLLDLVVPGNHRFGLALASLMTTVVGLAVLNRRLQRLVDRLFYRTRHYDEVLRSLGRCLQSDVGTDMLLPSIVGTVASGLGLPHVAITVGDEDDPTAAAAYGQPCEPVEVLPLVHRNEIVGCITVAPRNGEKAFDTTDRQLLDSVAGQLAVVAYALCLSGDLQRSRERLVATREEERRRMRRDLHDGLQPALAGVTLGLEAVRNVVGHGSGAGDLLGRLTTELETAAADVRRLVYDLRPPALDELGLVGALRQQAVRFSMSAATPQVVVKAADDLSGLPAAVEVAAYRICQEALENVRKHAVADHCEIVLAVVDGALNVEVRDNGVGMVGTVDTGVGLVAMRERAAELGGMCTVESSDGPGTCVRAVLPLR